MVKRSPEAYVQSDHLEWTRWDEKRTTPFVAEGARGEAWVKVLSRDLDNGAESLLYKLDRGWSAAMIESTVYENLFVLSGEIEVGDQTLPKYGFSYRPEGHRVGSVSTTTGATVIAIAGAPGDLASPIPVPCLDTEAMPWTTRDITVSRDQALAAARANVEHKPRYYLKMLRGDEENLETFSLMRALQGTESTTTSAHDAPEEGFFIDGRTWSYDDMTGGRYLSTPGTYVHRPPGSEHGLNAILEDTFVLKHDYFSAEDNEELFLGSYPKETPAVKAVREGRDPKLPKRW
jgi:quercetin dioxygenase-like cupin family protein